MLAVLVTFSTGSLSLFQRLLIMSKSEVPVLTRLHHLPLALSPPHLRPSFLDTLGTTSAQQPRAGKTCSSIICQEICIWAVPVQWLLDHPTFLWVRTAKRGVKASLESSSPLPFSRGYLRASQESHHLQLSV